MPSSLRNSFGTLLLAIAIFWLGYESNERGWLKINRPAGAVSNSSSASDDSDPSETTATPSVAEPSPTPLPAHFPAVAENDLASKSSVEMPLGEAFVSCWPGAEDVPAPESDSMTIENITALFGKIKKREVLEKTDQGTKLGLILETDIFKTGAAGSATELDGQITEFKIRADGHILQCRGADHCHCM